MRHVPRELLTLFPLSLFPPPAKEFLLPVGRPERYWWTIPNLDKARIDSDVVYDEVQRGMTECFAADSNGLKFNAGFVRSGTRTPTLSPTSNVSQRNHVEERFASLHFESSDEISD